MCVAEFGAWTVSRQTIWIQIRNELQRGLPESFPAHRVVRELHLSFGACTLIHSCDHSYPWRTIIIYYRYYIYYILYINHIIFLFVFTVYVYIHHDIILIYIYYDLLESCWIARIRGCWVFVIELGLRCSSRCIPRIWCAVGACFGPEV